ncbi:MAG: roadblock/LC7 domain-containing protein [candidate division Zixibacteria bacterium]|nr:roadblock/LC7 domain-containing protein [candidate division Zixibacteria bacterium]
MVSDHRREIRRVLLISLFLMVVPLIFFPKDFGLRVNTPSLLSAFEFGWYVLIFFILFSKASGLWVLFLALLTLIYRLFLGVGFGLFLVVMFSCDLSFSLKLGIYHYLPAFLLQAMISPFALRSSLGIFMKKPDPRGKKPEGLKKITPETPLTFSEPPISKSGRDQMKVTSSTEKKRTKSVDLESALRYLREYSGVKGAILVDDEGLVVESDRLSDLDPETFASLAVNLKETNNLLLKKINEKGLTRMEIHTPNLWINLNQILSFTLVTVADNHTDELLSVRISQATGMIEKHLKQRYNQKILKGMEE